MRAYTVATAAVALNAPAKLIDNILSHHHIRGVIRKRQGIARRLSGEAVTVLEIALRLSSTLGITVAKAISIADALLATGERSASYSLDRAGRLTFDLAEVRSDLEARLSEAVESAPIPHRGRPRRRT